MYRSIRHYAQNHFFEDDLLKGMIYTHPNTMGTAIRTVIILLLTLSIFVSYYVMVIKKDYEVITNPEGPVKEDEA